MTTSKYDELKQSPEYSAATAAYSNAFTNGAGRQRPGTVGFALWLLYDLYARDHNQKPPSKNIAIDLATTHGLNETSAVNALYKWSAYRGFIRPRTGTYAMGPKS